MTQINAENAEFAEKVSCADCYLEKRRVEKDYLRNAIEEVVEYWHKRKYLHSVFSALSVNSAVNLTMSSYIPRVKVKRDFYFLMAKLEREFALRHLDKWEREAEEMKIVFDGSDYLIRFPTALSQIVSKKSSVKHLPISEDEFLLKIV